MIGGIFEISFNGSVWLAVGTVDAPAAGWNVMDVAVTQPVRFVRYRNPSNCQLLEFQVVGVALAATSADLMGRASCKLTVGVAAPALHASAGYNPNAVGATNLVINTWGTGGLSVFGGVGGLASQLSPTYTAVPVPVILATATSPASYSFDLSLTPTITGVSPSYGTALGGTLITISGTRLPTSLPASVVVNGVPCAVQTVTDGSSLTCITGPRGPIQPSSFSVSSLGAGGSLAGKAVYNASLTFEYIDAWSAISTWGNEELPVEGDLVFIPEDQCVLLDVSPPILTALVVQGKLVFDRQDLTLSATYIFVPGGKFQIGTEAQPFLNKATINLYGDRLATVELPDIGSKVLAVSNKNLVVNPGDAAQYSDVGIIDIHGQPRLRTWTKVAMTAEIGSLVVVASENVDFIAGESIIITSVDDHRQTEEATVAALGLDSRTITLTAPLRFHHSSQVVQLGGRAVDMRCEVGLLSRNVVIQGMGAKTAPQLFGAHTAAVRGGILRIENAELRSCGQAYNKGRGCVDFQEITLGASSYARFNSIHRSWQRGITVSASNNVRIQHNLVYKSMGHSFALETGSEKFNVFDENLAVMPYPSNALLISEWRPAGFFTPTPLNIWRNNIAVGSTHHGFSFELLWRPVGRVLLGGVCPVNEVLGGFFNNTAHANGANGLHIFPAYTPLSVPCNIRSPSVPQTFNGLVSFRNRQHGIYQRLSGDVHFDGASLLENGGYEVLTERIQYLTYSNIPHLSNLLAVGSIARPVARTGVATPQLEFYQISNARFINYGVNGVGSAIFSCPDCMSTSPVQGGYTVRVSGLAFENVTCRVSWGSPFKDIFLDLDGSLSGIVNGTAAPFYAFNNFPECPRAGPELSLATLCGASTPLRRLQIDGVGPGQMDLTPFLLASAAGNDTTAFRTTELYGWAAPIVANKPYDASFRTMADWTSMRLRYSEPELVTPGEWLQLSFNYSLTRYAFTTRYSDTATSVYNFPDESSALSSSQPFGTGRNNFAAKKFDIMLATGQGVTSSLPPRPFGPYSVSVTPVQCSFNSPLCDAMNIQSSILGEPLNWSSPSSWMTGVVPTCGQDVVIPANKEIVLDTTPCRLGNIIVYGKLSFLDNDDRFLQCSTITVYGTLQVGTQAAPFQHRARILLFGTPASPSVTVSNTVNVGKKVIVVFGRLDLWGTPRMTPWTKLAATAMPGDTSIALAAPCDWTSGDMIAITGTEYNAEEMETLQVANVSADGLTVTLMDPISFRHFAGSMADGMGGTEILAAAVGLLTRNVVVEGALRGTTDTSGMTGILSRRQIGLGSTGSSDTFGAHVYVGDVVLSNGRALIGSARIDNTQFLYTGKAETQFSSIMFVYSTLGSISNASLWPRNFINGSSFTFGFTTAISSFSSRGLLLSNNVFHRCFDSAVDVDAGSVSINVTANLAVGVYRNPQLTASFVRSFAAFHINTNSIVALTGNVAGSSQDAGFIFRSPDACNAAKPVIRNNEAHSALVGFFVLPSSAACVQITQSRAWKCAHIGVLSVDQSANVLLSKMVLADNHIGVTVNYFRNGNNGQTNITDSRIFGSSPASTCSASVTCRAQGRGDSAGTTCNSVLGTSYRRVGVLIPQYLNRAKTCGVAGGLAVCRPVTTPTFNCFLPWEKRSGLPGASAQGNVFVSNTSFAFFQDSDCGLTSKAIALNPTQIDYTPPLFFNRIAWHASSAAARLSFGLTAQHPRVCEQSCDSVNFAVATDNDGTFLGAGAVATIVSQENPSLAYDSPACTPYPSHGSIVCPAMRLAGAMLENYDLDRAYRWIGPVQLTKVSPSLNRTAWSRGPLPDSCSIQPQFGQFPMMFEANQTYSIYTTGSIPSNTRIQYFSTSDEDSVLLKIFFTQPYALNVLVNGATVAPMRGYPTLASARGANVFDPQQRTLYLVLRGSSVPGQQIYDIRTSNMIQLSVTLSVTAQVFFGPTLINNIATLLGIPSSRVVIANVHAVGARRRRDDTNVDPNVDMQGSVDTSTYNFSSFETPEEIVNSNTEANITVSGNSTVNVTGNATGGLQISIQILPASSIDVVASNTSALAETIAAQQQIMTQIRTLAETGTLQQTLANSGMPVVGGSFLVIPPPGLGAESSASFSVSQTSSGSDSSSSGSAAAPAAVGVVCGVLLVVVAIVLVKRKQQDRAAGATAAKASCEAPLESVSIDEEPASKPFEYLSVEPKAKRSSVSSISQRRASISSVTVIPVGETKTSVSTNESDTVLLLTSEQDSLHGSEEDATETADDVQDVEASAAVSTEVEVVFAQPTRPATPEFLKDLQQAPVEVEVEVRTVSSALFNEINERWARPDLTRSGAFKILATQRMGSFIVYGNENVVEIAVRLQGKTVHFPIYFKDTDPPRFQVGINAEQIWHLDLVSMVEYYQIPQENVPFVLSREGLQIRSLSVVSLKV